MAAPFDLHGKSILVTGASSGIGKEAAIRMSQLGGTLIITGRNKDHLRETFELLQGSGHQILDADLVIPEQLEALVDLLPELDGVVFSAGITGHLPVKFITRAEVDTFFGINYTSVVLLTARLLKKKKLKNKASLVFLSSTATRFPYYGGALYSSTKAALEAYSKVLAVELAPKGIRSNCISPSFVKTPMVEGAAETISKEVLEKFEKMMPLGFGEPGDVANAIIFLVSDASSWITGTNLVLGGG
jgi:NAD(P)-dependent dehydrogenase (short-subunit alcohol dehydrogenase family)